MVYSDGSVDLLVEVGARDLNNYTLPRAGEEMEIALSWNGTALRSRAFYSEKSQLYYAEITLTKVGRYAINITTPLGTKNKATFAVACKDNVAYKVSETGKCELRANCHTDSYMENGVCKSRPLMALTAASEKLIITLPKVQFGSSTEGTVEVRLASGDVPSNEVIRWSAASSVKWLRLVQLDGSVTSQDPVAVVRVVADASGLNDTSIAGPYTATITVRSNMNSGRPEEFFMNQTNHLRMDVEVSIKAMANITEEDVRVETSSGSKPIRNTEDYVVPGESLLVYVYARDYERQNISRADQQILLELVRDSASVGLTGSDEEVTKVLMMVHLGENVFRGEIPANWIALEGDYSLQLNGTVRRLSKFHVKEIGCIFVIVAVSTAIPLGILAVFLIVLVYRHRDRARELITSFLHFEMHIFAELFFDVIDIVGTNTSPAFTTKSCRLDRVMCPVAPVQVRIWPSCLEPSPACVLAMPQSESIGSWQVTV
jgi:hypothetical protein